MLDWLTWEAAALIVVVWCVAVALCVRIAGGCFRSWESQEGPK